MCSSARVSFLHYILRLLRIVAFNLDLHALAERMNRCIGLVSHTSSRMHARVLLILRIHMSTRVHAFLRIIALVLDSHTIISEFYISLDRKNPDEHSSGWGCAPYTFPYFESIDLSIHDIQNIRTVIFLAYLRAHPLTSRPHSYQ